MVLIIIFGKNFKEIIIEVIRNNDFAIQLVSSQSSLLRDKKLTNTESSQIEEAAKNMIRERNAEPVLIMENLENEEIQRMINKIRKIEKIIQQEKQKDKIDQENYKLEPEIKEIKEEILRKIYQIKHMEIEEGE